MNEAIVLKDSLRMGQLFLAQGYAAFLEELHRIESPLCPAFDESSSILDYFVSAFRLLDESPPLCLKDGSCLHVPHLLQRAEEGEILSLPEQLDEGGKTQLWSACHKLHVLLSDDIYLQGQKYHRPMLTEEQKHALFLLRLICVPLDEFPGHSQYTFREWDLDVFVSSLDRLRPDILALIRASLSSTETLRPPVSVRLVQTLVDRQRFPQPDSDQYLLWVIQSCGSEEFLRRSASTRALIPRLFQIEGVQEISFSACDKYNHQESWHDALIQLSQEGVIVRADLLDWALDALAHDWIQFRSGWFSRLLEGLQPSVEELHVRQARYLALCHSRIGPTVSLALAAIKTLQKAGFIRSEELLQALPPVLAGKLKGQITTAARLLDAQIRQDSALRDEAEQILLPALAFDDATLQGQLLKLLQAWGVSDALREELAQYQAYIAPSQQGLLQSLITKQAQIPTSDIVSVMPAFSPALQALPSPVAPEFALSPIQDQDELVLAIGQLLEKNEEVDLLERVLAALVCMAPFADTKPFAPVIKRARSLSKRPEGSSLAICILQLLGQSVAGFSTPPVRENSIAAFLQARFADLQQSCGSGLVPLSCASHQNGFIAPEVLLQRWQTSLEAGHVPVVMEQVRALLRLPAYADPETCARIAALPDDPFLRAIRYALGDDIPPMAEQRALFLAAARIRSPWRDDPGTLAVLGPIGPDGSLAARYGWQTEHKKFESDGKTYAYDKLNVFRDAASFTPEQSEDCMALQRHCVHEGIGHTMGFAGFSRFDLRYAASLIPSDLNLVLAQGLDAIGNNICWSEAAWQDRAYLDILMLPTTAFNGLALNVLALALCSKEPGLAALSRDVALNAWLQGRYSAPDLGQVLGEHLSQALVIVSRYGKCLKALAGMHQHAPQLVFDLLGQALILNADPLPKDIACLMSLLHELRLELKQALPPALINALQGMRCSGKAESARKLLLESS